MHSLKAPTHDALATFQLCTSVIQNDDLAARMKASEPEVEAAANAYRAAAADAAFHTLDSSAFEFADITTAEAVVNYDSRMARVGAPARTVYDALKIAARERCPLCAERQVASLDHYLPKRRFPALAVDPCNLVPACLECNKVKLDHVATEEGSQSLHPYFDELGDVVWLNAEVKETFPPTVSFAVQPVPQWGDVLTDRVVFHFKLFRLAPLYAVKAADELGNLAYGLAKDYERGGADAVRASLWDDAMTRAQHRKNSWQAATYRALAASTWFCSEGFSAAAL